MSETAIALRNSNPISTFDDVERAAKAMAGSGFFTDSKNASQAVVKILAGRELGFGPFASMTGVHIIQGKPSVGANLLAAAIKSSGKYDYKVKSMTETECIISFYEGKNHIGDSGFNIADAEKAQLTGKSTWKQYPKNLLFARAISNGCRWFCPDIFNGAPVYTPEELGADVDGEGNVITISPQPQPQPDIPEADIFDDKPDPISLPHARNRIVKQIMEAHNGDDKAAKEFMIIATGKVSSKDLSWNDIDKLEKSLEELKAAV